MKITDIKTRLLHVPVESALVNQTKSVAYMEVITVEIFTDEGLSGCGYTYTDGFGGHAIKALIDTDIRTLLLQKDPLQVRELSRFLLWELRQAGFAGITVLGAAGVDLALWDLYSQGHRTAHCQHSGPVPGSYSHVCQRSGLDWSTDGGNGGPCPGACQRKGNVRG